MPLQVRLGLPIHHPELCNAVCVAAEKMDSMSPQACQQNQAGQNALQDHIVRLSQDHAAVGIPANISSLTRLVNAPAGPPVVNLLVNGQGQLFRG